MTTFKYGLRDNVIVAILIVMIMVLSVTAIQTVRLSQKNAQTLNLVKECVLPEGKLCKSNPDATRKIIDEVVNRVNAHTDDVLGVK